MLKIKQHLPFVSKFHPYILASSKSCPGGNWQNYFKQALCNNRQVLMPCDMSGKAASDKLTSDTRPTPLIPHLTLAAFPFKSSVWEHARKL